MLRCEEIMTRGVQFLLETDTVEVAARRMRAANIGFLPVTDRGGKLVGALTDRDIAIRVCAENKAAGNVRVAEVMTKNVVTVPASADLREAEDLMRKHRIGRLVVADGKDNVVGVLSLSDIAFHDDARATSRTLRDVSAREARRA